MPDRETEAPEQVQGAQVQQMWSLRKAARLYEAVRPVQNMLPRNGAPGLAAGCNEVELVRRRLMETLFDTGLRKMLHYAFVAARASEDQA